MPEAELLNEVHFLLERSNYLTQWWASMSLGLILVAHFAKESLNLVFVSLLLIYISASDDYWGKSRSSQIRKKKKTSHQPLYAAGAAPPW